MIKAIRYRKALNVLKDYRHFVEAGEEVYLDYPTIWTAIEAIQNALDNMEAEEDDGK